MLKYIKYFIRKLYYEFNGVKFIDKRSLINFRNDRQIFFSQKNQDIIALNYMLNYVVPNKVIKIIDIGSNHPVHYNNTFFFEKNFKTEIYSIDPQSNFESLYSAHRKCFFINCAIGSKNEIIDFYIPQGENNLHENNMFASADIDNIFSKDNIHVTKVKKNKLIEVVPFGDYDILFIDVEGFEFDVLKGIDFNKFSFKIIIIENNRDISIISRIRKYLKSLGYKLVARIDGFDDIFINF
jgi:FkbM family methyltransferase